MIFLSHLFDFFFYFASRSYGVLFFVAGTALALLYLSGTLLFPKSRNG